MKFRYKTFSQKQLGQLFGVSSHDIGKWLVKLGLRDERSGKPTRDAHQGGYCETAPSGQTGYHWAWSVEKTVERFVENGYPLLVDLPDHLVEPALLCGPFRFSDFSPKDIVNDDGSLAARASCRQNAEVVMKLLDLAHQRGVINRLVSKDMTNNKE